MRIFASDLIKRVMGTFKIPEDEPIYNSMISRSLEKAQTKIEELNFDARKHVLAYDDVLNVQRQSVYARRRLILTGTDEDLAGELERLTLGDEESAASILRKREELGDAFFPAVRRFLLQGIDYLWVEHLEAMEYLRSSVNLRAYGQRDPLVEYKKEGLRLFQTMEETYREQSISALKNLGAAPAPSSAPQRIVAQAAQSISQQSGTAAINQEYGRNDKVTITDGTETLEMKYKKAEEYLKKGWRIVR